jgi:hypothetical protein
MDRVQYPGAFAEMEQENNYDLRSHAPVSPPGAMYRPANGDVIAEILYPHLFSPTPENCDHFAIFVFHDHCSLIVYYEHITYRKC